MVQSLISAQVDIIAKAGDGITALLIASEKSEQRIVQTLIAASADVNARMREGVPRYSLPRRRGTSLSFTNCLMLRSR